ncbi:MAG: hypothetical protein RLY14_2299 [Planctomycetota bacterium]|jgi:WD40 repeat protein/tRNA A-37 threonylcarbamoyl transferase component Bud32
MTNQPDPESDNTRALSQTSSKNDFPNPADAPTLQPAAQGAAGHPEADTLPPPSASAGYSGAEDATLPQSAIREPTLGGSATQSVKYFGDYELLSEIARGGMGVVYKARQVNLNRLVALKMILAGQLASDEDVKRFYTEAEAAAALEHPGIVPIFEIGQHNEQHFFSMGFVDGGSLAEKIKNGPLPSKDAATYTKKVAEAIAYAHSKGVIHRDLKPANILLDRNDEPKVTDFGLARRTESNSDLTRTGAVMGTPSYMPPEQAAGRTDQVGPLADVYSLGAILYCLLTGGPPFQASNPLDTLMQVLKREPVSVTELNPTAHRDVETICHKCLQKEPTKRYGSAQELADDLNRYIREEPIQARAISRIERVWRWSKRNPVVSRSIVTAVAAIFFGAFASLWFGINAKRSEAKAMNAASESVNNLYVTHMQLALNNWLSGRREAAVKILDKYKNQTKNSELRGFEWSYLDRVTHSEMHILSGHELGVSKVIFSPDGKRLLSSDGNSVKLWVSSTGGEQATFLHEGSWNFAISSDGKKLATAGTDQKVKLWDVESGKNIRTLNIHEQYVYDIKLSHDSPIIVSPGIVRIWDFDTGNVIKKFEHSHVDSIVVSPDERNLVSVSYSQGTVKLWDIATALEIKNLSVEPNGEAIAGARKVTYSPDGMLLATASDKAVVLWDTVSWQQRTIVPHHQSYVTSVAFSPDSRFLACASKDGKVKLWDVLNNLEIATLADRPGPSITYATSLAFSSDGKKLAVSCRDGSSIVYNTMTGNVLAMLIGHRSEVSSIDFSPDGMLLASASADGIKIWDSMYKPMTEVTDQVVTSSLAFSSDGSLITSASSWDGKVISRDVLTGQASIILESSPAIASALSSDGTLLATANSFDGSVRLISIPQGSETLLYNPNSKEIRQLAFSNDGLKIAMVSASGTIQLWDVNTKKIGIKIAENQEINRLAFSNDGKHLAVVKGFKNVGIYDVSNGKELLRIDNGNQKVTSLSFSPNSEYLATAIEDGLINIWNVGNGLLASTLTGHTSDVFSLSFSPDGKRLASSSPNERMVKLWDLKTNLEAFSFSGRNFELVLFNSDGTRLAASCIGGILIWDARSRTLETGLEQQALCLVKGLKETSDSEQLHLKAVQSNENFSEEVRLKASGYVPLFWRCKKIKSESSDIRGIGPVADDSAMLPIYPTTSKPL